MVVWYGLGLLLAASADVASLKLQNSQYLSHGTSYYRADAGRENSSLAVEIQTQKKWRYGLASKIHVKDEWSQSERWNYLNVYDSHISGRAPGAPANPFKSKPRGVPG